MDVPVGLEHHELMSTELRWTAISFFVLCAVCLLILASTQPATLARPFLLVVAAMTAGLAVRAWIQARACADTEGRLGFLSWGTSWPILIGLVLPFMCLMVLMVSIGLGPPALSEAQRREELALVVIGGALLLAGFFFFLVRRMVIVDLHGRTVESSWGVRVLRRKWTFKDFHAVESNVYTISTKRGYRRQWKVQLVGAKVTLTLSSSIRSQEVAEQLAKELSRQFDLPPAPREPPSLFQSF
jgi:hypothetical protein